METRHINYKSDFVIRERFRGADGKFIPLPAIDFEIKYWVGVSTFTVSRKNGVYLNCTPDEDSILVTFKDHNLGEGELYHELKLSLDNSLFESGTQTIYYPESLNIWLWDKIGDVEGTIESDYIAAYTRGEKFEWSDFTPENILELQKPAIDAAAAADQSVSGFINAAQRVVDEKVSNAINATEAAETATENAINAKIAAETATENAINAKIAAETATGNAINAKVAAEGATQNAINAKVAAEGATQNAINAKVAAETATENANNATQYANSSAQQAATAAEGLEATRTEMESIMSRAETIVQGVPTGLKITTPETVTFGNPTPQYIKPAVKPDGVQQNVIYQTDGKSLYIEPSGMILIREIGITRVHIIPTQAVALYKTINIEVIPPRIRLSSIDKMRLDKDGNIRLT